MLDRFDIVRDLCLRIDERHPALEAYRAQRFADAAALARSELTADAELAPDFGMLYVVARARAATSHPIEVRVAELFARWKRRVESEHAFYGLLVGLTLSYISKRAFDEFVLVIAAGNDDVTSTVYALAAQASPDVTQHALGDRTGVDVARTVAAPRHVRADVRPPDIIICHAGQRGLAGAEAGQGLMLRVP